MLKRLSCLAVFLTPFLLAAQPKVQFVDYASGFTRPVDITHCGDNRLFVVEKAGYIRILDSAGNKIAAPFIDITDRVLSSGNEQGLLGLAFHPNYAQNGYFWVYYTKKNDGGTRVSRFSRDSVNINKADPNSEQIVLEQSQPYSNHNGGCIKFSPTDGYLYIGLGDGGSAGDPQANGQKKTTFLGKILRIDVTPGPTPYTVPADNPFVSDPAYLPEIWSLGWRNPWRFSFDQLNGDLWVGDVGQNAHEEIDYQPAGQGGGNYGWRCYEGNYTYNTNGCPGASNFIAPVYDYANPSVGCSVTGGIVYRGAKYPDLYGVYLYGDYCSGRVWATRRNADGTFTTTEIANFADYEISNFGEDAKGELYVSAHASGKIQKIRELCSPFQVSASVSDPVCVGSQAGYINLNYTGNTGAVTFSWSNGAVTQNNLNLDPGTYRVTVSDANGCQRRDSFQIVSASPAAPALLSNGDTLVCAGQAVLLQVSEAPQGFDYQWYRDGQILAGDTSFLLVTEPGVYTAAFVSAACNSPESASAKVQVLALPQVGAAIVQGDSVLCPGETITIGAGGTFPGDVIAWVGPGVPAGGANGLQFAVSLPGVYYFTDDSYCGQTTSNSLIISAEPVVLPLIFFNNDTLRAAPGYASYQWLLNGIPVPGATGPVLVPLVSGAYSCNLSSANGCNYTDVLQVDLVNATLPASVEKFALSPNPTSGLMHLEINLKRSEHIRFYLIDTAQREIFMQTAQAQHLYKVLELNELPAGTYYLHVDLESGNIVRTIVKN